MVDPIQRQSTVPLPAFQTEQGFKNPLPLDAPKEQDRLEDTAKTASAEKNEDGFADYLNKADTLVVEKTKEKSRVFDPAAEIAANSVYGMPNGRTGL